MILVLGVIDIPYANAATPQKVSLPKKGKANRPVKPKAAAVTTTTGEVAEKLEARYQVMARFAELHERELQILLMESLQGTIINMANGGPNTSTPFEEATEAIRQQFHNYLEHEDITVTGVEGVPTKAALAGVDHRLKLKRGPRRPSFIDTGLYEDSFKAWTE